MPTQSEKNEISLNYAFNKKVEKVRKEEEKVRKEEEKKLNDAFDDEVKRAMGVDKITLIGYFGLDKGDGLCVVDSTSLVSGYDKFLKLWEYSKINYSHSKCKQMYSGHMNIVKAVCALNAKQFVSGSEDKTLKLWNVDSPTAVRTFSGHTDSVTAVCKWTRELFVSGSDDKTLKLWHVDSPTAVKTYTGHTESVTAVCAMKGMHFVSGSRDKTLKLWNLDSSTAVRTFSGHTDSVTAVCALNAKQFVSGSEDKTLILWNFEEEGDGDVTMAVRRFSGHTGPVKSICTVNDKQFVSGSEYDGTLKIWNVDSPTAVFTEEVKKPKALLIYDNKLVTATRSGKIFLYNSTGDGYFKGGALHNENVGKGGKRRNKKSKKLNKRSVKRKFRKTRRKSRKSRK